MPSKPKAKLRTLKPFITQADYRAMRETWIDVWRDIRKLRTHGLLVITFEPGGDYHARAVGSVRSQAMVSATAHVAADMLDRHRGNSE